jgi:hypothetical protein
MPSACAGEGRGSAVRVACGATAGAAARFPRRRRRPGPTFGHPRRGPGLSPGRATYIASIAAGGQAPGIVSRSGPPGHPAMAARRPGPPPDTPAGPWAPDTAAGPRAVALKGDLHRFDCRQGPINMAPRPRARPATSRAGQPRALGVATPTPSDSQRGPRAIALKGDRHRFDCRWRPGTGHRVAVRATRAPGDGGAAPRASSGHAGGALGSGHGGGDRRCRPEGRPTPLPGRRRSGSDAGLHAPPGL